MQWTKYALLSTRDINCEQQKISISAKSTAISSETIVINYLSINNLSNETERLWLHSGMIECIVGEGSWVQIFSHALKSNDGEIAAG